MTDEETPRSLLKKEHAIWCEDARAVTRVTLAPVACYEGASVVGGTLVGGGVAAVAGAVFKPVFIHQIFDEDLLFGYTDASLRIWIRDPDLAVCVTASARSVLGSEISLRVATAEGKSKLVRVGADDVAARLRVHHVLSLDSPPSAFVAAVGADANIRKLPLMWGPTPPTARTSATGCWAPPGERVAEYTRGAVKFGAYAWCPAVAPAYHTSLGSLGVWSIENKSAVDFSDEKWSQVSVYEESDDGRAVSTVGFVLLYRFSNPMRSHRPDTLRLAQLVIVPRYQRAGHGESLLEIVYARTCADEAVLELGVEDPCEGMSRLRDAVDIKRAWRQQVFGALPGWEMWIPTQNVDDIEAVTLALAVNAPSSVLAAARATLRCTRGQAQRAFLALLLVRLRLTGSGACGDDAISRAYRLLCKRITLESDADIKAIDDAVRRKEVLEDRFQEMMAVFIGALARIKVDTTTLASKADAELASKKWAVRKEEALAASAPDV